MSRSRDGQIFTIDIIVSLFIFVLIVNLSLMTWNVLERNTVMFNEEKEMRDRASRVADLLVRTPGYPHDWTAGTVEIVGLADPDHVLDTAKMEAFADIPYDDQKQLLRTRQSDFSLTVVENGSTVDVRTETGDMALSFGNAPTADAETVVIDTRNVLVNGSATTGLNRSVMELVFWR